MDANALDATDNIENRGTSQTRPFRSIQRALVEVTRYSYQSGVDNDRFGKSTILVAPGTYIVDNRPGAVVRSDGSLVLRSGASTNINQWDITSNFDLSFVENELYKLNSIYGGVIVPRGCSIIGSDLRKVKIIPLYVPNPENEDIERSAVFRVTGACFLYGFSVFDSDPNGNCYKDYTRNLFVPNFSHHKLTAFEYADGVNPVVIDDEFQSVNTNFTDLQMYYDKVARVYGESSGRDVPNASYTGGLTIDLQPVVDEYRIVGSRGREVGITSIRAGDGGSNPTATITVTFNEEIEDLSVDSPIEISGVPASGYNGQFVVFNIISSTELQYRVQNTPSNVLPAVTGATLNLTVDTVTSASPYVFNVSLRSVYGMCGLHADGLKADGFKSMVVAQFTGIGLQKDDNAFVIYDNVVGAYRDSTVITDLHRNSRSRFKPEYDNYHIKASNNAFLQLVSIFAIGYSKHFIAESGGDFSITNSNSNFGAKSLVSTGFRDQAFPKDDVGYITHIIPPQELETEENSVEFLPIDIGLTVTKAAGAATTTRLYLYNKTNFDEPPLNVIDGYRIGAKNNEILRIQINQSGITSDFSCNVVMPGTDSSYEKSFSVSRTVLNTNNISNSTITLSSNHNFQNGETVRIISDNGHLPDGLQPNQIYYVITKEGLNTLGTNQIRLAQTLNNTVSSPPSIVEFNNKGGNLKVVSKVSDKSSGEIGHPIQWDDIGNWYINVSSSNNELYSIIDLLGVDNLGEATSRSYFRRRPDIRNLTDTLYRFRYVVPKDTQSQVRPPLDGYVIQESNNQLTLNDTQKYFSNSSVTLNNSAELRNLRFISNAVWSSNYVTVTTELPHDLLVGTEVQIENIVPSGYNGTYDVTEIINSRQFKYFLPLPSSPGVFSSDTSTRNTNLPIFKKKTLPRTFQVYRTQEIQPYIQNEQDGIYHLIVINSSNSPTVSPFQDLKYNQPIQNLYPQTNRDNPISDPDSTRSFALPEPIGQVVINNPESSLTKETLEQTIRDFNIGFGITSIVSNSAGTSHTIFTELDHGLSGITSVSIISGGSNYITGTYYAADVVGFAGSTTGKNASVKIIVNDLGDGIGSITSVEVMHGGSVYGIGNTLRVIPAAGIGTTAGFTPGVLQVTSISNDIDDILSISGVSEQFFGYNTLYRVTGISSEKQIQVSSSSTVTNSSTVSIGITATKNASVVRTGKSLVIDTFEYTPSSGIATIGFTTSHGLIVNNKVRLSGFDSDYFNKDVIVKRQNNLTSVVVSVGKDGEGLSTIGTSRYVYQNGYTSNGGILNNESITGRLIFEYGGVTSIILNTTLPTSSEITVSNALTLGLKLGDYLQINNEILRIRSTVTSNTVSVFRSLFGSRRETHTVGSVIRRINVTPIEFRRNSIIRASGHTFEYLGFGPGNYSTAFPERQDRILTPQEELIAQSTKENGGIVIFTAMNSDGDFYTGNKKINSATGQEEVYETPIPTVTGEELNTGTLSAGFDVLSPLEATINRSIRVEGGPDNNLISEFDGPVVFNNKITSYSDIETNSLLLQGNSTISRKYTVGISTPTVAGNIGDVVFKSDPQSGGYLGWVYALDNSWRQFASISTDTNELNPVFNICRANEFIGGIFRGSFVGDGSGLTNIIFDSAWVSTPVGVSTTKNVGISTNATKPGVSLYVNGNTNVEGTLKVFEIIERATISSGILTAQNPVGVSTVTNVDLANNNVYYYTSPAQGNWSINFRGDSNTTLNDFLEVGESITVAIMATQGSTAYYNNTVRIDNVIIVPKYYGGTEIISGNSNSIDMYTYVIIKTAPSTFTVLYSQSQYA